MIKELDFCLFDSWIILKKDDKRTCTCSYCEKAKSITKKITFWSPQNKSSNSWRVFVFDGGDHWTYLRFTLPTWKCIVNFTRWTGGWRFQLLNLFGKTQLRCLLGIKKNNYIVVENYREAHKNIKLESLFWMKF